MLKEKRRVFRSPQSFLAERITRDMMSPYLASRGFTDLVEDKKSFGNTVQQIIHARTPAGEKVAAHVRLCWRRDGERLGGQRFSAVQLLSKIKGDDWIGSLQAKVNRDRKKGVTHTLLVQRDGNRIVSAALIPLDQLIPIWEKQRDVSSQLIANGRLESREKNHATNGSSPTLWLHDAAAPEVGDLLWSWPGVVDLNAMAEVRTPELADAVDDTWDDCPGIDYSQIGSDGGGRVPVMRSMERRNRGVRKLVIERSAGRCERSGCGESRPYTGFLDVHHILGVGTSDRYYNCVALCPNCHREAHFSPDSDAINAALLKYAEQFRKQGEKHEAESA